MKISAYHKAHGDCVEWWFGDMEHYDIVYMSRVFDDTYSVEANEPENCDNLIKGGTGYSLVNTLPNEMEHMMPDYSLYPTLTKNTAYGFLTRGCPWNCGFCIVSQKEGYISQKVADLSEWWNGQKNIILLDPNTLACREHMDLLKQLADSGAWVDFTQGIDAKLLNEDNIAVLNQVKTKMIHFAWDFMKYEDLVMQGLKLYSKCGAVQDFRKRRVYVLTNYDTTQEENLYRVYKLREMYYDPYIMIYDKPNAPQEVRHLARWEDKDTGAKRFEDYDSRLG